MMLWAQVADLARRMTTAGSRVRPPKPGELAVAESLKGHVTKAVMKAD